MEYQFKTNINCGGCVASITPHLNANKEVKSWKVDTADPQKVLTVETDTLSNEAVREIVVKACYRAEKIS
ncbi:MAG: heavy-metal-associated domain-containing protein [Ferruginibacter sp.]